jgi:restriction endonuclease Mrr
MPIPEFNEIKVPAIQFFADGQPHKVSEVYEVLAKHFNLTEEELSRNDAVGIGFSIRFNWQRQVDFLLHCSWETG